MKLRLRTVIFWLHLGTGVGAGLVVAIMGGSGALMAFEPQLLEWAERSSRRIPVSSPPAARVPIDQLVERARAMAPRTPPTAVTVYAAPDLAVRVTTGRRDGFHANPYTGELRPLAAPGWRSGFQTLIDWHRALGLTGEKRAVGRAITGACNLAFLFLALSGLYLWWPRKWTGRGARLALWFRRGLSAKARDFNWHNVIGFWTLPVLIVLIASGLMISYGWASNLIARLTGDPIPAARGPAAAAPVPVPQPPPGARPMSLERLLAAASQQVPAWQAITLRMATPSGGAGNGRPQAATFSIKEAQPWPLFSNVQVSLDPFTGATLRRETFADSNRARRIRLWLRFLHTGEALGWPGQLAAGVASLGATFLVWTGLALALRRLFPRRVRTPRDARSGAASDVSAML